MRLERSLENQNEFLNEALEERLVLVHEERLLAEHTSFLKVMHKSEEEANKGKSDGLPLFLLRQKGLELFFRVRRFLFLVVKDKKFDSLCLLLILVNMAFMIFSDPNDDHSIMNRSELFFVWAFSIEALVKMIGLGLLRKKDGYFKDSWNLLDFIILLMTVINVLLSNVNSNISALRTLRVLRPLKTISSVRKLKTLIITVFGSLPFLFDIVVMLLFIYLIFAISGVQLFSGVFSQKCFSPALNAYLQTPLVCVDDFSCPLLSLCVQTYVNPDNGLVSYDSLFNALYATHKMISANGFDNYFQIMQSASFLLLLVCLLYYVTLIFFGVFLLTNLMLAVIVVKFTEASNRDSGTDSNHDSNCLCLRGANFQQMKESGYLLAMSNLAKNNPFRNTQSKYTFEDQSGWDKRLRQLEVEREFKFLFESNQDNSRLNSARGRETKHQKEKANLTDYFSDQKRFGRVVCRPKPTLSQSVLVKMQFKQLFKQKTDNENSVEKNQKWKIKSLTKKLKYAFEKLMIDQSGSGAVGWKKEGQERGLGNNTQSAEHGADATDHPPQANTVRPVQVAQRPERIQQALPAQLPLALPKTHTAQNTLHPPIAHRVQLPQHPPRTPTTPHNTLHRELQQDNLSGLKLDDQFIEKVTRTPPVRSDFPLHSFTRASAAPSLDKPTPSKPKNFILPQLMVKRKGLGREKLFGSLQRHDSAQTEAPKGRKTQREIEVVLGCDHDDLDLFLNPCKTANFDFNKDHSAVFPHFHQRQSDNEASDYTVRFLQRSVKMVYRLPTIHDQTDYSLARPNHCGNGRVSRVSKLSRAFSALHTADLQFAKHCVPESVYEADKSRSEKFYFFHPSPAESSRLSVSRCDDPSLSQLPLSRPFCADHSSAHQKSHNYFSISKFFSAEFPHAVPLLCRPTPTPNDSTNNVVHKFILQRDLNEGKVMYRNWSGFDVTPATPLRLLNFATLCHSLNHEMHDVYLTGLYGLVRYSRRKITDALVSPTGRTFFMAMALANIVMLTMDSWKNQAFVEVSESLNVLFTGVFLFENALKMFGLGVFRFSQDWFNTLELCIALASVVELLIGNNESNGLDIKVIRVFRSIRVLRIIKLLKSLKFMRIIAEVIKESLEQIFYITMLLFLLLAIFALIGNQMFAGQFNFYGPGSVKRQNFDTFYDSFVAIFSVMTVQNWDQVLLPVYQADNNAFMGFVLIFGWMVIGNYVLLNLFIAILLSGFANYKALEQEEVSDTDESLVAQAVASRQGQSGANSSGGKTTKAQADPLHSQPGSSARHRQSIFGIAPVVGLSRPLTVPAPAECADQKDQSTANEMLWDYFASVKKQKTVADSQLLKGLCDESLFLFSKTNRLRIWSARIVQSKHFDRWMFTLIILSSLKLIIDSWETAEWLVHPLYKLSNLFDGFLVAWFVVEALLNVIKRGLFMGHKAYLREAWSVVDFLVMACSIAELTLDQSNASFLKTLRSLRTFRALRFISHNKNLKIVAISLLESIGGIANVSLVIILFWVMYAIFGINLLSGKLGRCEFPDNRSYYYVNTTLCDDLQGQWVVALWNFDNIFNALVSLFALSSLASWTDGMWTALDANDPSVGPVYNNNFLVSVYFWAFILVSSMFLSNLFIGIIFYEFTNVQNQNKQFFPKSVTEEQNRWLLMQKLIKQAQPNHYLVHMPRTPIRKRLFELTHSPAFEGAIMGVIVLNSLAMAMTYQQMNPVYAAVIDWITFAATVTFVVESAVKLLVQSPAYFFTQPWNRFDFGLALTSVFDLVLSHTQFANNATVYSQIASMMRLLRIVRILKLTKTQKLETLKRMIQTLVFSIPALLGVFSMLVLIYFFYAILGVFLFKDTDDHFRNFVTAFCFTFKLSLGESWLKEMTLSARQNGPVAYVFYLSNIFLNLFIILKIFVFVLIQEFESFYLCSDNIIDSFEDISNEFQSTWLQFTAEHRGAKIHKRHLFAFFSALKAPLGFSLKRKSDDSHSQLGRAFRSWSRNNQLREADVMRIIGDMHIYHNKEGFVSFGQVLHAALKRAFGKHCLKDSESHLIREIRRLELKTVAKIFRRLEGERVGEGKGRGESQEDIESGNTANPFVTLILSQALFKLWYLRSKDAMEASDKLSEEYQEMMEHKSSRRFEERIRKAFATGSEGGEGAKRER